MGWSGPFEFAWVRSGAASDRLVHSGSRGGTRTRLGVVGFADVHLGWPRCHRFHSGSLGFIWTRRRIFGISIVCVDSVGLA